MDENGNTPLMLAAKLAEKNRLYFMKVCCLLIKYGANPEIKDI